jgi:hypothetical protein
MARGRYRVYGWIVKGINLGVEKMAQRLTRRNARSVVEEVRCAERGRKGNRE